MYVFLIIIFTFIAFLKTIILSERHFRFDDYSFSSINMSNIIVLFHYLYLALLVLTLSLNHYFICPTIIA